MSTVVAIYTGQGLAERIQPIFREILPNTRLISVMDDSLIGDVIRAGKVTPAVTRRLVECYRYAEELGADVIFNTCSSIGEVADWARPMFEAPIVKIDDAMAQAATAQYSKLGVLATLPSTLEPTGRLVQREAVKQQRQVEVVDALAAGAYQALVAGKPEEHDRLILEAAKSVASKVEALVLAQGSMIRMEEALKKETGIPVFSSPRLGVLAVKAQLEKLNKLN